MGRVRAKGLATLILALGVAGAGLAPSAQSAPSRLRVGRLTLQKCGSAPPAYCGRIAEPLDHASGGAPYISVYFHWYPALDGERRARGTVVPVEGGPGYPSIGSVEEGFGPMYGPLLRQRNMLVVDNRGTGRSAPIECPPLQDFSGPTASEAFRTAAAACAQELDAKYHTSASDLFSSAAAAGDMADLIRALRIGPVDIYGDSYGSFYAQVFAVHFPELVRSVTLDSTYSIAGLDPWYRSSHQAMSSNFTAVCARWSPCAKREPLGAWARLGDLAQALREHPLAAKVPGPEGTREPVRMDVVGLVDLLNDAAGDPTIYAGLDAAARAALAGHPDALLRLYAQRLAYDENYFGQSPHSYSPGLYLAVSCVDYPQLFDMSAPPAQREAEFVAAQEALPASTFAPFTTGEWLAQDQNTEAYSACLKWPAPTIAEPPATGSAPLLPPTVPVLVLGGELDSWTPPGDVSQVLADLGGKSRFVEIANSTHVVGEADTPCGSTLVRAFVAHPNALASLPVACAHEPPLHAVGEYPQSLSETPAADSRTASSRTLRLAQAALQTAGDATARLQWILGSTDSGLYGGQARLSSGGVVLNGDQLIPGVRVSGRIELSGARREAEGERVVAHLTAGWKRDTVHLVARWTTRGAALARISGSAAGHGFSATAPAP